MTYVKRTERTKPDPELGKLAESTRSSFPIDEAVSKPFCLWLNSISKKLEVPLRDWKGANRFTIQFEERILLN
jgi:transposase-like protein